MASVEDFNEDILNDTIFGQPKKGVLGNLTISIDYVEGKPMLAKNVRITQNDVNVVGVQKLELLADLEKNVVEITTKRIIL